MDGFAVMNMRGSSAVLFWSERVEDAHDFARSCPELSPETFLMTLREAIKQRATRVRFALPALSHAQLMRDRDAILRDIADAKARIKELHAELKVAA